MFKCFSVEKDYAVIRFYCPQMAPILQRIPISYTIAMTMPIHAFGFPGYKDGQAMVINGEIIVIKQNQFQLSLLSAPGLSGSAIIADDSGRAVGYLGVHKTLQTTITLYTSRMHSSLTRWLLVLIAMKVLTQLQPRNLKVRQK
jgi:hypothetical protein